MKLPTGVIKRGWEVHLFKMEVYSWENHRTKWGIFQQFDYHMVQYPQKFEI